MKIIRKRKAGTEKKKVYSLIIIWTTNNEQH